MTFDLLRTFGKNRVGKSGGAPRLNRRLQVLTSFGQECIHSKLFRSYSMSSESHSWSQS